MKDTTRRELKQLSIILAAPIAGGAVVFFIFFRHS